jgi:flagellar biosynthesis protein FlhF
LRIKKYLANDIKEALRIIKEDLGPDAVIIRSRKVRGKGLRAVLGPSQVEVTAAIEEINEKRAAHVEEYAPKETFEQSNRFVQQRLYREREESEAYSNDARRVLPAPGVKYVDKVNQGSLLYQELEELKIILRQIKTAQDDDNAEVDFYAKWHKKLLGLELDELIVERLLQDSKKGLVENGMFTFSEERMEAILRNSITRLIEPIYQEGRPGRVLAFIGPTGVGKTTTLAKLAAQFALFYKKRIALITIDTYRIGATEQLRIYGEIIGVSLDVVITPEELGHVINRHKDKDIILIDTTGRPSKNVEQVQELKGFIEVIKEPKDVYLVLSATTKKKDLYTIVDGYRKTKFNKLIFTKIDETDTLGCIINISQYVSIPVVYITDGQNVPDDIDELHPKKAAKLVLRGNEPEGSSI